MKSARQSPRQINVGTPERWLSLVGGSAILLYGLRRRLFTGLGLALAGGGLVYRGVTGHCRAYRTLGISTAENAEAAPYKRAIKMEKVVLVDRPPEELYRFWRQLENLPSFMSHLDSVQVLDPQRSRWVAKGPAGSRFVWEAEIIHEIANELIAWQSTQHADVYNSGSVHFYKGISDGTTEVRVVIRYAPPLGALGNAVAKIFGEKPERRLEDDLRRFKQIMETGEIPFSPGQSSERAALAPSI